MSPHEGQSLKESLLNKQELGQLPEAAPTTFRRYRTRWYILLIYSLFTFYQCCMWALPGPISKSYQIVYGLSNDSVQLLVNYGPIAFLPTGLLVSMWLERKNGVRQATLCGIALVTVGCILRAVARSQQTWSIALIHLSYLLNGLAGPAAMAAVSQISQEWFAPHERTTATSIMAQSNAVPLSQLLGPYTVTVPDQAHFNTLSYICLGMTVPLMVAAFIYFPAHPPTPPSASAAASAEVGEAASSSGKAFLASIKSIVTNPQFWVLGIPYGVAGGVFGAWASLLSMSLPSFDPAVVGWMAFTANSLGNVAGIVAGRIADKRRNHAKLIITLLLAAGACFLVFSLAESNVFPAAATQGPGGLSLFYLMAALGGMCCQAPIGLYLELAVEALYPAPEGVIVALMALLNNALGLLFLAIPTDSIGSSAWMSYFNTTATLVSCAIFGLFYKPRMARYDFDTQAEKRRQEAQLEEKGSVGMGQPLLDATAAAVGGGGGERDAMLAHIASSSSSSSSTSGGSKSKLPPEAVSPSSSINHSTGFAANPFS